MLQADLGLENQVKNTNKYFTGKKNKAVDGWCLGTTEGLLATAAGYHSGKRRSWGMEDGGELFYWVPDGAQAQNQLFNS